MLAKDIKVGKVYRARVSGVMTTVKVNSIEEKQGFKVSGRTFKAGTRYMCTNTVTGKTVTIKSAAKFRGEALAALPLKAKSGRGSVPVQAVPLTVGTTVEIKEDEQRSDPTPTMTKTNGTTQPGGGPTGTLNGVTSPPSTSSPSAPPKGNVCGWDPRNEYGYPRFRINGRVYDFRFIAFGIELSYLDEKMNMVTWKVTCNKAGVPVQCNCPSDGNGTAMVRCKHVRALKAAIPQAPYPLV